MKKGVPLHRRGIPNMKGQNMTHKTRNKLSHIYTCTGLIAVNLATLSGAAWADPAMTSERDSLAVITIPNPREASLLQLRGYVGAGTALLRIEGQCHSMPVRFVAGDFGGSRVSTVQSGPIRLRITRAKTVQLLYDGTDLVSEDHGVVVGTAEQTADIVIESGLSAETGFVINPGQSVLADLFGVKPTPVPCSNIAFALPAHSDAPR
jgi:hypothetical protein